MKTTRSNSMPPPATRSTPSSPTTSTQSLQRSPSAPDLGGAAKTPATPKSPGDNSSFSTQPKASGSHVPQNTGSTSRPPSAPSSPTSGPQSPKTVSSSLDAEMARNKAQLGGAQPRNAPLQPDTEQMAARVRKDIGGNNKFEVKYNSAELNAIQNHGKQLGLPQETIDNMVKIGSRNDTGSSPADKKRLSADELKAQMSEYKNVEQRKFPHLFHDKAQFDQFSQKLRQSAAKNGLPSENIVIQGSSVRTSHAGDVDVACLANKQQFSSLMSDTFSQKIKCNNKPIDLSKMDHAQMQTLAKDIENDTQGKYNSKARTFAHAVNTGCFKPSNNALSKDKAALNAEFEQPRSPKDKDPKAKKVHEIAVVLQGSPFDTTPNLPISK